MAEIDLLKSKVSKLEKELKSLTDKNSSKNIILNSIDGTTIGDLASDDLLMFYDKSDAKIKYGKKSQIASGGSGSGDLTAVVAGNGLTGTGLSGPIPTLNVVGGTGITASADEITIDSTVTTLTGSQTLTNKTLTTAILGSSTATTHSDDDNSTKVATTAYVDSMVGGVSGTEITLTDTAPTTSSDFSSTDIILEKDTGKLWWYSATNSKLYSHTYDSYVDLDFNIASFSDNLTSTFFIKDEGQTVGNISYNLTINNPASSTFTGTISLSGETNSSQTGSFPLDFDQTDCSGGGSLFTLSSYNEGSTIPLLYPDNSDSWSGSGTKVITSSASVNDDSGAEVLSTNITFKNKKFYGYTTATDPTAGGFNIYDLQTASYVTTSYTQAVTTINTSASDNYFYYAYPARISGTPVFKINGLTETGFTLSTTTKTNQASNGYSESYKVWKSPQIYNDATFTIEVS